MTEAGLNPAAMERCREQLGALAKPPGSLGRLEEYAVRLAGIRGRVGGRFRQKAVLVFAADNGLCGEDPGETEPTATCGQSELVGQGLAAVNVFSRLAGAKVCIYDIGMRGRAESRRVKDWNVMRGTRDIRRGPAMTRTEFDAAFSAGRNAVAENEGCDIFGVGELGAGSSATAAAVAAVLLGLTPEEAVAADPALSPAELAQRRESVRQAIEANSPEGQDAREVVARVGGLDIAAMAGAYLECAKRRLPVVIDGSVSACAALVAFRLRPAAAAYMFPSQQSSDPVFRKIMAELNLEPPLDLEMRIGEGTSCPFMFVILEGALLAVDEMATLEAPKSAGDGE